MLNKVAYQGRLTADPIMRYTGNQTPVCSFNIAVERDFADKETGEKDVDFFPCVAWRKTGEFIKDHFEKGDMILVTGRNQSRSYEDKNGNQRDVVELVIDNAYFCQSKRTGTAGSPNDHDIMQPSTFEELEDDGTKAETLPF